jgi:hypothetical protein
MTSILLLMAALHPIERGEIFGDIRAGDAYVADAAVQITCGAESAKGITDRSGSFRLKVGASGKCKFSVTQNKQTATIDVVLFDQPSRYRFVLEVVDGKPVLKRV